MQRSLKRQSPLLLLLILTQLIIPCIVVSCKAEPNNPIEDFNQKIREFGESLTSMVTTIKEVALNILLVAAGAILVLGALLWVTDIFRYYGKRLVITGLIAYIIISLLK